MLVILIVVLIISFLLIKIEIRILNIIDETDVYIKIGIVKVHIDYDLFIKNISKISKNRKFSISDFKNSIGYYNIIKNIVNNSNVNINKLSIIKKSNTYNFYNIYYNTVFYSITTILNNFLLINTKKQKEMSFLVLPSNENDIDIDIDFDFSLLLFLKSCIENIKNINKIKKDMI